MNSTMYFLGCVTEAFPPPTGKAHGLALVPPGEKGQLVLHVALVGEFIPVVLDYEDMQDVEDAWEERWDEAGKNEMARMMAKLKELVTQESTRRVKEAEAFRQAQAVPPMSNRIGPITDPTLTKNYESEFQRMQRLNAMPSRRVYTGDDMMKIMNGENKRLENEAELRKQNAITEFYSNGGGYPVVQGQNKPKHDPNILEYHLKALKD